MIANKHAFWSNGKMTFSSVHIPLRRVGFSIDDGQLGHHPLALTTSNPSYRGDLLNPN